MDVNGEVWKFFDRFLKGEPDALPVDHAEDPLLLDGRQRVEDARRNGRRSRREETKLYLRSGGTANSMFGDGKLSFSAPRQ